MTENQNDVIVKTNDFKLKIDSKGTILNYGNLLIKKGDFVMIEGPNGSGKSTFLKLLVNEAGEYCSLESGSIFIDGKNLFDYDKFAAAIVKAQQLANGKTNFGGSNEKPDISKFF